MELDSLSLIPTAIQWISLRFHETSHVEQPYQPYVLERNLIPIQKLPRKRGTTGHQTSIKLRLRASNLRLTTFPNLTKLNKTCQASPRKRGASRSFDFAFVSHISHFAGLTFMT